MYLEIPLKLEGYVKEIKEQVRYIDSNSEKIILLRMGKNKSGENNKLLYLMYNPFPVNLHVDCNFFTKESHIFKMYPTEFVIKPCSAYAFVTFVTLGDNININESELALDFKRSITKRLMNFNSSNDINYKFSNMYEVDIDKVNIDDTISIDPSIIRSETEEMVSYSVSYDKDIIVSMLKHEVVNDFIKLNLKFENKLDDVNIKINGFKVKIFSNDEKYYINVKEAVNLKRKSSKVLSIFIKQKELNNAIFDEVKITLN